VSAYVFRRTDMVPKVFVSIDPEWQNVPFYKDNF